MLTVAETGTDPYIPSYGMKPPVLELELFFCKCPVTLTSLHCAHICKQTPMLDTCACLTKCDRMMPTVSISACFLISLNHGERKNYLKFTVT